MYPDYLQDLRAQGSSRDEMGSVFLSAERFVQQWEKSCRLAQALDPAASNPSCRCDPGTSEGRSFCPAGSPRRRRIRSASGGCVTNIRAMRSE